ncbi:MAG: trehalose-6-phosphate synthase [Acidobacteriia bacterium]|nr:trehalose-6-phosphate synthase [Terriglobia bacterium]
MRITFRLIFLMFIGITVVALLFARSQVKTQKQELRSEVERRADLLGEGLQEGIEPLLQKNSPREMQRLVERFGHRERLMGVVIFDANFKPEAMTTGLSSHLGDLVLAARPAFDQDQASGEYTTLGAIYAHIYSLPLHSDGNISGTLVVVQNASDILTRSDKIWRDTFFHSLVQTLLIALITLLIVRWSVVGPIFKTAQWMKELRTRGIHLPPKLPEEELFKPLMREATHLAQSLSAARAAAEEEARLRDASESIWTEERLRIHVQHKLKDRPVFVVSNREPYMHVRRGKGVEAIVPASGLVTALEPILRACDGTWIAHGAAEADHETVDSHDRLRVPPDEPQYTLRRVWLTREEEEGYYYGFSNEGLWPLCHIAHTRPIFRSTDWEDYQAANQKFAGAVLKEMEGSNEPTVLIQDYHFALLPQLIKRKRPDARVAIFWHIPWPNPQAFGICPWQRELLDGMLGADLIGFHVQSHCNYFLETVAQALEARVDWEHFAVSRSGHVTRVKPFPISVAFSETAGADPALKTWDRASLIKELGLNVSHLAVGVDRVDYTKGILERFHGVERFLDKYPNYRGRFTLVQIGAPSRTHIKRYHDFQAEVEAEAERINWRYGSDGWKPIVFLNTHHSHKEIDPYYRAADVCLVTSLHDGMNLVAKEFVAARTDERGALILSQFTGACRELPDAIMVNPYDTEQLAEAIRFALEMDPEDSAVRMHRMRKIVREHNVYSWAASLIGELADARIERPEAVRTNGEQLGSAVGA